MRKQRAVRVCARHPRGFNLRNIPLYRIIYYFVRALLNYRLRRFNYRLLCTSYRQTRETSLMS